jgi:lactoylglutathione lyase
MLGLFETHLDVTDLDRSVAFYTSVLGLELAIQRQVDEARTDAHSRGARRFALLWVGGQGNAMLGLWERAAAPIRAQHFAFEVSLEELPTLTSKLSARGIQVRDFFQEATTTPSVFGFIPAASIYFDDPDGHVLELLARIPAPPHSELVAVSWKEWTRVGAGSA